MVVLLHVYCLEFGLSHLQCNVLGGVGVVLYFAAAFVIAWKVGK